MSSSSYRLGAKPDFSGQFYLPMQNVRTFTTASPSIAGILKRLGQWFSVGRVARGPRVVPREAATRVSARWERVATSRSFPEFADIEYLNIVTGIGNVTVCGAFVNVVCRKRVGLSSLVEIRR